MKLKNETLPAADAGPVDCHVRPWDVPLGGLGRPLQERVAEWFNRRIDAAMSGERERCLKLCARVVKHHEMAALGLTDVEEAERRQAASEGAQDCVEAIGAGDAWFDRA